MVKTIQPTTKTGRKWKVSQPTNDAKERLNIKEEIGQTQIGRKWLESSVTKSWSKVEKEKRDIAINEIRQIKDSRRVQKAF